MRAPLPHLMSTILMLVAGSAVAAAESPTHECAAVPDPLQRLSCYDKTFPPKSTQTQNAPTNRVASEPLPQEEFGFTDAQRRDQALTEKKANPSPQEIRATVSTLKKMRSGMFVATLDNGHVW